MVAPSTIARYDRHVEAAQQRRGQTGSHQLDEIELAAWKGMLFAYRNATVAIDERLEREHDLTLSSYEVLLILSRQQGEAMRMGQLAEQLLLSRSGLTRLVDRLVKRGLVERHTCSNDRRGTYAKLTAAGIERFEEARPTNLAAIREQFVSRLEPQDLEDLARVWRRLEIEEDGETCG